MRQKIANDQISTHVLRMSRGLVIRANSLLITIYGDAIAPRKQPVWLGSLITMMELFGVSPRLVRTSAFRLTADDWLTAMRIGRRSFYKLSETGLQRVQHADRRIYEVAPPAWDGYWTLAALDTKMRASARQHLRRELLWEGFGQVLPNLFAHPHADHGSLREILKAANAEDQVAMLRASAIESYSRKPLQTIMRDTYKLEDVELAWKQFIARFSNVLRDLQNLNEAESFFVRTLLIHEYRRVLLRDPNLPEVLLPSDWPGIRAKQLCEAIYRGLLHASERFLLTLVETPDGKLGSTPSAISQRMGGVRNFV
jgi:phenylacetic acid degradation operon negative regulatory protein